MRRDPADEDDGDAREDEAQPQPPTLEHQPIAGLAREIRSFAASRRQCSLAGPQHDKCPSTSSNGVKFR
jgi:hypothetical protein